jgi:hypothetical protein
MTPWGGMRFFQGSIRPWEKDKFLMSDSAEKHIFGCM